MSAQTWMIIGIVGLSLAAALIFTAVLLFIRWKIPSVVGDLTGRTEKKQIKKMLQDKAEAANKVNLRPEAYEQRDKDAARAGQPRQEQAAITDVLGEQADSAGTEALSGATDVLGTDMLAEADPNATTILSGTDAPSQPFEAVRTPGAVAFNVVKSVVVVHTSEVIE